MRIEKSICPLTMLVVEHAYNAYREEHLSAYKMDVRDYFGSQKTNAANAANAANANAAVNLVMMMMIHCFSNQRVNQPRTSA